MTTESQAVPDTDVEATLAIQQSVDGLYQIVDEFHLDVDGNLSRSLQRLRHRAASNEITLTVLGEFTSGKSTFINSLLRTDLLRIGILPINAVCTYISYGPKPRCEVTLKDGRSILVDPKTVSEYSSEGPCSAEVARIKLQLPSPLLADGLVVVDTPGVNVNIDAHESMTASTIEESNACVYIIDSCRPGSKTAIDFLRRTQDKIGKFFFVLNRADILDNEEQEEALLYVKNVLVEECGIADPRVSLLSSTLARDTGAEYWNRCFEELEQDLRSFMRNEALLIIANEVARHAVVVGSRAEYLLNSKWSLTEHELAIHYKTRLPDSKELIARLRAETDALVERAVQAARSGFKEYHQQLTTQLRILITDAIRSADSRKALNVSTQQAFGNAFESASQRLQEYLVSNLRMTYEEAHATVARGVSNLLSRIALLEERAFLSRISSYLSAFAGGVTALVIALACLTVASPDGKIASTLSWGIGSSLLLFVGSGMIAGLMVARLIWGRKFRQTNQTRTVFSASTTPFEAPRGLLGEMFRAVFPPSIEKMKRDLLARSLKVCDSYSAETTLQGVSWIESEYGCILYDLRGIVDETVSQYEKVISRVVRSQKSVANATELRLGKLRSALKECMRIQAELAQASGVIRTSLGEHEGRIPTSLAFVSGGDADVALAPFSDGGNADDHSQGKDNRDRTAQLFLWWGAGVAAVVMFLSAFLLIPSFAPREEAVATVGLPRSSVQTVEKPRSISTSDSYRSTPGGTSIPSSVQVEPSLASSNDGSSVPEQPTSSTAQLSQRSDAQIETDVVHMLGALKALKSDLITVTTIQSEVTLSGTVSNDASSELAEWTVSHVSGVTTVHNNLQLRRVDGKIRQAPAQVQQLTPEPAQARSGLLHYYGPPVAYGGQVVFDNLPKARLRFTYDRTGWQLTIKIYPDGTKWVTLTSLKQGIQTSCDLGWEIVE